MMSRNGTAILTDSWDEAGRELATEVRKDWGELVCRAVARHTGTGLHLEDADTQQILAGLRVGKPPVWWDTRFRLSVGVRVRDEDGRTLDRRFSVDISVHDMGLESMVRRLPAHLAMLPTGVAGTARVNVGLGPIQLGAVTCSVDVGTRKPANDPDVRAGFKQARWAQKEAWRQVRRGQSDMRGMFGAASDVIAASAGVVEAAGVNMAPPRSPQPPDPMEMLARLFSQVTAHQKAQEPKHQPTPEPRVHWNAAWPRSAWVTEYADQDWSEDDWSEDDWSEEDELEENADDSADGWSGCEQDVGTGSK